MFTIHSFIYACAGTKLNIREKNETFYRSFVCVKAVDKKFRGSNSIQDDLTVMWHQGRRLSCIYTSEISLLVLKPIVAVFKASDLKIGLKRSNAIASLWVLSCEKSLNNFKKTECTPLMNPIRISTNSEKKENKFD